MAHSFYCTFASSYVGEIMIILLLNKTLYLHTKKKKLFTINVAVKKESKLLHVAKLKLDNIESKTYIESIIII